MRVLVFQVFVDDRRVVHHHFVVDQDRNLPVRIQFQELGEHVSFDPALIPAYTKNGFDRVQNLKLTVAEAQFASQFNGSRSLQQIAKNLRLDLKFARLTLFRFLALEIVECWRPTLEAKPEGKGILQRFTRSIGLGD